MRKIIDIDGPDIIKDEKQAYEFWLDTPFLTDEAKTRHRAHRSDFNANETGLRVRKSPFPGIEASNLFTDFGMYAGKHGDKYIVLVIGTKLHGYVAYDTFEQLCSTWELD